MTKKNNILDSLEINTMDIQDEIQLKDASSAKKISNSEVENTLKEIKTDRKCSEKEAFIAIALLCQNGGTSPRADANMKVCLGDTTFTLGLISKAIRNNTKKTVRRFAKAFANEFYEIAKSYQQTGNLTNKINLHNETSLSLEQSYWAADFQSDNPDCPEEVRKKLNEYQLHYNNTYNIVKKIKK